MEGITAGPAVFVFPPKSCKATLRSHWTVYQDFSLKLDRFPSQHEATLIVNLCCDCKQLFTSRKSRLWCDDCAKVREPWRLPKKDEATREWERQQARNRRIRLGQPAVRLCKRCGQPATSSRSWYCDPCRAVAVAKHRHTHTKSAIFRWVAKVLAEAVRQCCREGNPAPVSMRSGCAAVDVLSSPVRAEEPASRYFHVEELPFKGLALIRVWISILAGAAANGGAGGRASPARVCIIDRAGAVLYEKRCYVDDTSFTQDLRAIVEGATVAEVVEMYELPVSLG